MSGRVFFCSVVCGIAAANFIFCLFLIADRTAAGAWCTAAVDAASGIVSAAVAVYMYREARRPGNAR